ncbi:hypothetical protein HQ529_03555 [Candidatus Woesearchaeota archaeon]|nr:hypothetical protein [Candidatus Woesearchaeota archaeon]
MIIEEMFTKFVDEYLDNVKKFQPNCFRTTQLSNEMTKSTIFRQETNNLREPFMRAIRRLNKCQK